jgi:hypothetical protein
VKREGRITRIEEATERLLATQWPADKLSEFDLASYLPQARMRAPRQRSARAQSRLRRYLAQHRGAPA